jgi:benzoyl-CoA-dihydrodiol lyase
MLRQSTHAFKVNFCKFTNETRLYLEDASAHSGLKSLAALNGTASGGGYELALACDRILLVDDRNSAVSFPELPLLGVLPGTGGLTRLSDKRKVRRDRADVFSRLAEGIKGKRAVEWNLVDELVPLSRFDEAVAAARASWPPRPAVPAARASRCRARAAHAAGATSTSTCAWPSTAGAHRGDHADAAADAGPQRRGRTRSAAPGGSCRLPRARRRAAAPAPGRALDRHVTLHARRPASRWRSTRCSRAGAAAAALVRARDAAARQRVLKRLDLTARSLFAVVDEGSGFARHAARAGAGRRPQLRAQRPDQPVRWASRPLNAAPTR